MTKQEKYLIYTKLANEICNANNWLEAFEMYVPENGIGQITHISKEKVIEYLQDSRSKLRDICQEIEKYIENEPEDLDKELPELIDDLGKTVKNYLYSIQKKS